jgi:hypothetical protein
MRATQAASAQRGYFLYLHKMRNRFSYFISLPIPAVVCLKEKEEARVNQTRNQFASLAPKFNGQKGRGNDVDFVDCLGYRDDVLALLQL